MIATILIVLGVFGMFTFGPRILQGLFQNVGFPGANVIYNAISAALIVLGVMMYLGA